MIGGTSTGATRGSCQPGAMPVSGPLSAGTPKPVPASFDVVEPTPAHPRLPAPLPPTGDLPKRVILIVDDTPEDVEVTQRMLRRATGGSYVVRVATTAREGLAALAEGELPDCVLLDYHLPDLDGGQFLTEIGSSGGDLPVPIVIFTGSVGQVEVAVRAMRLGALDYQSKDLVTAAGLLRSIEGAIDRFRSARLLEAQQAELARRNQELDERGARTLRLLGIATALSEAATMAEVGAAIVREGVATLGAQMGALSLAQGEAADGELRLVHAVGLAPAVARAWDHVPRAGDTPFAVVARDAEPLWLESREEAEARFPALATLPAVADVASAALLPLSVRGQSLGALAYAFDAPRRFDDDERAFLRTLAGLCAQALDRARLYDVEHALRTEAERQTGEAEHQRREADRANRAKSDFLAMMSHELRTPLNAIAGHVQLVELGILGPLTDEQRASLDRVQRAQRHLLRLINDVLNLAKLEAGKLDYDMRDVALDEVAGDVVTMIEPQFAEKALPLRVEVAARGDGAAATPVRVWADREKLAQILLNLLSNAAKFTAPAHEDASGGVVVRIAPVDRRADLVGVAVVDTGVGIPAEKLASVFEPFVQVDAGRTRVHEGTGLGLAISRDLARGMGGELTAESVPGEGSTFTLVLRRAGLPGGAGVAVDELTGDDIAVASPS